MFSTAVNARIYVTKFIEEAGKHAKLSALRNLASFLSYNAGSSSILAMRPRLRNWLSDKSLALRSVEGS